MKNISEIENNYNECFFDENIEKYNSFIAELNQLLQTDDNHVICYYIGQSYCDLFDLYASGNQTEKMRESLDKASVSVKAGLKKNKDYGLFYVLRANILGKELKLRGLKLGPIFGPKINIAINKAFKYLPSDYRVYVESARRYIFTPPFFGGDLNKAINDLEQAAKLKNDAPEIYFWLGVAYKRKKQTQLAVEFLTKAVSMKQNYRFANDELKEISTKNREEMVK